MNKLMLVVAFAFIGTAISAAFALPVGNQPGMANAGSEITQIKHKKKMKGGMKNMRGMRGMDHSKMKM